MIRYIQADGEKFVRYINDLEPTAWDADNYCFVRALTDEQIKRFGVHRLQLITPPYYDPAKEARVEAPAVLIDGVWTQVYDIVPLDPAEAEAKIAARWGMVRAERNAKLAASDWTQLPDAPVDAEVWAKYRQALRDVTSQADPFNITWPTEPGA